jgi:pyruvate formate lyase activating enzyme
VKGVIFDVKEFTVHDGPGIRTTVFLKGCPLRCIWCHNPEGLSAKPQLLVSSSGCIHCGACRIPCNHPQCQPFGRCVYACPKGLLQIVGETVEAEDLALRLLGQKAFFEMSGGGVTISGGEPLMQPDFLFTLLDSLQPIHRIVETCGYAPPDSFRRLLNRCETIYMDIKHPDEGVHERVTGRSNRLIVENLKQLQASDLPYHIRVPLIPGINDTRDVLEKIVRLVAENRGNLERIDFMPYNPFAGAKYEMAGMRFQYKMPRENDLSQIPEGILKRLDVPYAVL